MATSGPSKLPTRSRIKTKLPWPSKSSNKPTTALAAEQLKTEPVDSATNKDDSGSKVKSLWNTAWEDLERKDPKSRHLSVLKKNFEGLQNRNTIAQDIANLVDKKQISIRGDDGISETRTHVAVIRCARFATSTKDVVMKLSALDPHGVATFVLGGLYTIFQVVQNDSDERRFALLLTLDISGIMALWHSVERYQISQNTDPNCSELYDRLGKTIIQLYQRIIVLLGTMMVYFDKGRWGQLFAAIVPATPDWTRIQAEMKAMESNCNNLKAEIALIKENGDRHSAVLKWISSYDFRASYKNVLERTQVNKRYSGRCQWFISCKEFETWRTLGPTAVLWLNGTIGTGKTTVTARVIQELKCYIDVETDATPVGMFFFRKATDGSKALLTTETCLQSLVRQLSWNQATSQVAISALKKYNELKSIHSNDGQLTSGECIDLLKDLVSERETYIVIDGVDECGDHRALLGALSTIQSHATQSKPSRPLHIMICGRSDLPVLNYFPDCVSVVVSGQRSLSDQAFFIDSKIDDICANQKGSIFFSPGKEYPRRLKEILKKNAGGLFRWIEIQIAKFSKYVFIDHDHIDRELAWAENHTSEDVLNDEYTRLLENLKRYDQSGRKRERALKLLRLIVCSLYPLDANDLAEALAAGDGKKGVDPDTVRRLLVGFVVETYARDETPYLRERPDLVFVQFAHGSVWSFSWMQSPISGTFLWQASTLKPHR